MNNSSLYYSVGALLYCPANRDGVAQSLISGKFGTRFSLAFCLEDTIRDEFVEEAERKLIQTLSVLWTRFCQTPFFLPKLFIRARNSGQILRLMEAFGESGHLVSGFIIPKFSIENADASIDTILRLNERRRQPVYMMPILESPTMISLRTRYETLYTLKEKLAQAEPLVLNIRVGGNDLCHMFGFRRHSDECIHSIPAISSILSDIMTVFGMDYVISGPVWEYYRGEGWDTGLARELRQDRLCGFVGKTVIHPKQIPLVNDAYRVPQKDLEDARSILDWDASSPALVSGGAGGERMNEYKTHLNWAKRTQMLADVFGTC